MWRSVWPPPAGGLHRRNAGSTRASWPPPWSCIPVGGWPAGIVGRRDAALVALICAGGLTRRQVRALPATPGRAPVLSPAVEPGACPACAVSRWLRVHALAAAAGWRAVRAELADIGEVPARQETAHDCTRPVRWPNRPARWPMFSAIDRHGWVNEAVPLSVRSITTVVACRLEEGERRSHSPIVGDLPHSRPSVQAVSPSGNRQHGLQARQRGEPATRGAGGDDRRGRRLRRSHPRTSRPPVGPRTERAHPRRDLSETCSSPKSRSLKPRSYLWISSVRR